VEAGETPRQALDRELHEELGIRVNQAWPWLSRAYVYPHAHVMLRFFRVTAWEGEPRPQEGQTLAWTPTGAPDVAPILPANDPVLKALKLPLEYWVSDVQNMGEAQFMTRLMARLARGPGFVQLREKTLNHEAYAALARRVAAICHDHGTQLALNGYPDLAAKLGVGLHLTSSQLTTITCRPDLEWVGASCHDRDELAQAIALELDWVVLGPVQPTASHPQAHPLGWQNFAELIQDCPIPVYALGGLVSADLNAARSRGAHGIAMLRGAWPEPSHP